MKKVKEIGISIWNNYFSIIDIFACLILAIVIALGPAFRMTGTIEKSDISIISIIKYFIVFVICWVLFRFVLKKINTSKKVKVIDKVFDYLFNKDKYIYKYRLLIFAIIIFAFWLPVLIALYPGTFANDSYGQLNQFHGMFEGYPLDDHHPVLDTLIMGFMILPLGSYTGMWHSVMFFYVIIQACLTVTAFSYTIVYAKEKLKLNNRFILLALIIYAILPLLPFSVQNINKDAIFSWIYVWFVINYIEIVRTNGMYFDKKKNILLFAIICIFCSLTKKVGLYVVLIAFLTLIFLVKNNKKKMILSCIILCLVMFGLIPFLFNKYNVKKGGQQEKLPLLFQQTARYLLYHADDVTSDEKELIEKIFGMDINTIVARYKPDDADKIKGYLQQTEDENYYKYIKVWFKQGLRHPKTYIGATCSMWSGWFAITDSKPLLNMNWHSQLNSDVMPESVTKREEKYEKSSKWVVEKYESIAKIPVIKVIFSWGFYTIIFPLFAFTTILKYRNTSKKRFWIGLVPLALSIGLGCLLAPVTGNIEATRYMYPLTYSFVATFLWMIYSMNDIEEVNDKAIKVINRR